MQKVILSQYNICLINFYKELKDYEVFIINDLHAYNLLSSAKIAKDVKKLLLHHIIYFSCNLIITNKIKEKELFYIYPEIDLQLYDFLPKDKLDLFITETVKKISKMLPLCFYFGEESFSHFCAKITSVSGFGYETLLKLLSKVEDIKVENYQFYKIKNFAKRNELTFLTQDFFNSFKTKQHLLI